MDDLTADYFGQSHGIILTHAGDSINISDSVFKGNPLVLHWCHWKWLLLMPTKSGLLDQYQPLCTPSAVKYWNHLMTCRSTLPLIFDLFSYSDCLLHLQFLIFLYLSPLFCPLYVLWCFHPAVYTDIANGELQRGKLEMTCIQIYEAIICQFDASVDISAAEERVSLL